MSFNRLNFDPCTYKHNLRQSVGPGDYFISTPRPECNSCFSADPSVNTKGYGSIGNCQDVPLVDVDSELIGLTRKASNCPLDHYVPSSKAFCKLTNLRDCRSLPSEDTRLSNPPCTLKENGWNRWEWLCQNPQDKALMGFDYNINNRLIVKDNHRPCIPKPINQAQVLPPNNNTDDMVQYNKASCGQQDMANFIPSTSWRKQSSYEKYI